MLPQGGQPHHIREFQGNSIASADVKTIAHRAQASNELLIVAEDRLEVDISCFSDVVNLGQRAAWVCAISAALLITSRLGGIHLHRFWLARGVLQSREM